MIACRGLRSSSQAIGIGRRCIDRASFRSYASATSRASIRTPSLLTSASVISRTASRPRVLAATTLISFSSSRRFQSSSPLSKSPEVVSGGNTHTPEWAASAGNGNLDSVADLSGPPILEIPERLGYLKDLGLDYGWGPTSMMQWAFEHVHVFTGLPWWGSILVTGVVLRAVFFIPFMNAAENATRQAIAMPLTKPLTTKMMAAQRRSDTAEVMALRAEVQRINKRAGVQIWKSFVPALQIFSGYGAFVLLRGMAKLPVPGFETQGMLWFQNLAVPDPVFILPVVTAGLLHFMMKRGGETGVNTLSPTVQKSFMYGLPVISLIFTAFLPSAVQLWFALNSVLGFFQAGLFRMAGFRAWAGMTPLPENARLVVDAAAAAPKSSPVQERVVVIEKGRQYRDKDSSSGSYQPPRKVTKEDKTILGGFKREVTGTIDSIKGSMKDTIKQGREMMKSQEGADGKRTKAQLAEANKYEEKRRAEEARRIAEMDERRKEARIQKRRRKSEA